MSDKLAVALEGFPNLASRALVMLIQDPKNAQKVEEWIVENAQSDIRFARLGEKAGLKVPEWKEVPKKYAACGI